MIRLRAGAATHVGQVRQTNQDSLVVDDGLFAVADGMGGHRGGEIASKIAVDTLQAAFTEPRADALAEAVQTANEAVVAYAVEDPSVKGMGTTMCALALVQENGEELVAIVNVGDSRCYLAKREGGIEQKTEDHSLVATLERQGQLTAEEAANHPHRNILTRALGIDERVLVDLFELRPFAGDRYLICSDGLFNEVVEDEIDRVLREITDPQQVAETLVDMANEGGGRDNITIVVVDVLPDDEHPSSSDAPVAAMADVDGAQTESDGRLAKVVHGEDEVFEAKIKEATAETPAAGPPAAPAGPVAPDQETAPEGSPAPDATVADTGVPSTRFTWRVALFLFTIILLVVFAFVATAYYARSTYRVQLVGDQLVVYKGRDVLWYSAELDESCKIPAGQISVQQVARLEAGIEKSSRSEVQRLILTSVKDPETNEVITSPCLLDEGEAPPSTTTTRAPTTTTTQAQSTTTTATDASSTTASTVPGG